jgi:hypothetical protein
MLYYHDVPGAIQTTNATPLTANDCFFIKPGATRCVWLLGLNTQGRGAGLTSISGITYRVEKWFTTASSAGTGITPSPNDVGYQAAKHTAAWAVATVTSGTGGPTLMLSIGSGTTSPGPWLAGDINRAPMLEANANMSLDVFNASGAASLNFEMDAETAE